MHRHLAVGKQESRRLARRTLALLPALAVAGGATAQDAAPPRYAADQLHCIRFAESVEGDLETVTGGRIRREQLGRDAVWILAASDSGAAISLEGWYDSLAVWRTSSEGTVTPDTDGLLGGRYRGQLRPAGGYRPVDRPFVPDGVAEVVDLRGAMDELLPPLPPRALQPGARWTDSLGLVIERLDDSVTAGGDAVRRYRVEAGREDIVREAGFDTVSIAVTESIREQGTFAWHPDDGVILRDRTIVVETTVPAAGPVRRPVRSRLEQRISLRRIGPAPPAACEPAL